MILQSFDLDAAFKGQVAQVRDFRISFDPANYLDLTGSTQLTDPFPFQADGQVKFRDVAVLNEFLGGLGAQPGLSGGININFTGTGDVRNPTAQLQVRVTSCSTAGLLFRASMCKQSSNMRPQTCRSVGSAWTRTTISTSVGTSNSLIPINARRVDELISEISAYLMPC